LVDGNILKVNHLCIILGLGATALPKGMADPFTNFFKSLAEIMYKLQHLL
jgi:Na+/H+-dicarboxylate symporter